jgi:hypothetical protein
MPNQGLKPNEAKAVAEYLLADLSHNSNLKFLKKGIAEFL